ncbi:ubiquitin-conjugating enzyme family protein [Striga asiatica]|uniref:Ubiquitin-conjugating enzyme family protein n=1 Tax=Striga asiatica TaxID=4170 RepID=A0A5A7PTR1_STRAF|nr:ubiquitin-conjugating enzyme family protein [Striga asiatica]
MESKGHSGESDVNGPSSTNRNDAASKPDEILKNLQGVAYIYRRDVVRRKTSPRIGIVAEVARESDSDVSMSDDDDEDEDDDEEDDESNKDAEVDKSRIAGEEDGSEDNDDNTPNPGPLAADQVRVLWMDGPETIENANNVKVIDRRFLHGDYVAAASNPTAQIGIVVDVDFTVDLLTHDGSILKNKPCRELRRIRDIIVGDHVVLGPWLGRVEVVFDNVTVQLDDGSACRSFIDDGHFTCYPGQRVKASSSSVFKNSRWLSGMWKANRLEGTVTKVTVGSVFVYWIASAGYGPDSGSTPDEEQAPKNLKLLTCFAHLSWLMGDWCMLPLSEGSSKLDSNGSVQDERESTEMELGGDTKLRGNSSEASMGKNAENNSNLSSKEAVHYTWPLHRKKIRKVVVRKDKKSRKKAEDFERALLIINTYTKVDVAWQDGSIKRGLDSASLIPTYSPGNHEFVFEQYVVEKAADSDDAFETRRVGFVKSVSAKDRTACIRWLKPVARAEDPREFDKEEMVSVYELERHPDYGYCYGDIVVGLSPISLPDKMNSFVHSVENPILSSDDAESGKERNAENGNDMSTGFSDLSWVGVITGLKNGDIEVTWADGMISIVIFLPPFGSDGSDGGASWETVEDDMNNAEEHETGNAGAMRSDVESNNIGAENSGKNGALSIPLAAIGFVISLAPEIFSRGRKHSDGDDLQSDDSTLDQDHDSESISRIPNDTESQLSNPITNSKGEGQDIADSSDLVAETLCKLKLSQSDAPTREEFISKFKGFDIVETLLIIIFLVHRDRKWLKKVQWDWDILQNNLPEAIYVRVYEDRMDLLRAVIVGAYGTPYQDGLFFFDFLLPQEYPDVPPNFEELVTEHFRKRGPYVLKACDAYMKGHLIGSLTKDGSSGDGNTKSNSVGFKLMLVKVVPKLFAALKDIGADCQEFEHLNRISL